MGALLPRFSALAARCLLAADHKRKPFSNCVRWETSIALCRIDTAWFSSERTATNRIDGRVAASQTAAASAALYLSQRT